MRKVLVKQLQLIIQVVSKEIPNKTIIKSKEERFNLINNQKPEIKKYPYCYGMK